MDKSDLHKRRTEALDTFMHKPMDFKIAVIFGLVDEK